LHFAQNPPTVILVAGVNGSGKTTSIAKLAFILSQNNKKVIVAACDTFRAAAVEQLSIWAERIGAQIIKQKSGSDPAAVAFDACEAAVARNADFLILDTAGRLHTQKNLMNQLTKIRDVVARKVPDAPNEVLLVLDATTGQNAIAQAKMFTQAIDVTGIFLAKLDGTARGGIVIAIKDQLDIPVKFVGLGEKPQDIAEFNPETFVEALFK
jgi:fused signal recognition particle receptor